MANINVYLQAIMDAVYGEDVRGSIHDAIEVINDVSEVVLSTGTAVTSASSSSTGYYTDSLYFNTNTKELWKCVGTDSWQSQGSLKGDPGSPGADGVGIVSIAKTASAGLVDTYTITYTDGNVSYFTVTNGQDGSDGVGIVSITKTASAGLVDTYTILYTDTNTSTFDVTNGTIGNKWYTGTVISGKSSTPTIFSGSGITYANTGDMYLNTSEGAIYHCYDEGDASTATWVYDFTLAGGGGGAEVLSDLTDVTISSPAAGQALLYDSGIWKNLAYTDTIVENSTLAAQSGSVYTALSGKQATLTFDASPTNGSSNPVTSGGVYSALTGKQDTLTAGNGIDITSNTISADVQSVSVAGNGTASSSVTHQQQITVNGSAVDIDGTKYLETQTKTTSAGVDTFSFSNADIKTTSAIDVYCDVFGKSPSNITVSNGSCAVSFSSTDGIGKVRLYIR